MLVDDGDGLLSTNEEMNADVEGSLEGTVRPDSMSVGRKSVVNADYKADVLVKSF